MKKNWIKVILTVVKYAVTLALGVVTGESIGDVLL